MVTGLLVLVAVGTSLALRFADQPPATSDATVSPAVQSHSPSTSAAATTKDGTRDAAAVAAVRRCSATIAGQEAVAKAAADSARDWAMHTDAQRLLDAGTNTLAQTKEQWATSKARGPADLTAYATATATAAKTAGGCDGLDTAATGTSVQTTAQACRARSAALSKLVSTADVVQSQWAAHLTMMAHKEHIDGAAYHDQWIRMVNDSGPALNAYRAAASAAATAPACAL